MTAAALFTLWLLALASLVVGTGALTLALIPALPAHWTWHHYRLRRPIAWALLLGAFAVSAWATQAGHLSPVPAVVPAVLVLVGAVAAHRLHQEHVFPAVDDPELAPDPRALPLRDDHQLAIVEIGGVSRAYPLDYVIHHHVINDRFGDRLVALTYCAMCNTVIAFDVTDIGPLFVGSFRDANMIVADRRTGTFFQQASFASIIGPLHPRNLEMVTCQLLSWEDVRQLDPMPSVVAVTRSDLRAFALPVPGLWERILASERTPGLAAARRDRSLPARTRVVGVIDRDFPKQAWLKADLLDRRLTRSPDGGLYLVGVRRSVVAFRAVLGGAPVELVLDDDGRTLREPSTGRAWDLRGHARGEGPPLVPVALSDEFWFSWRLWHPEAAVTHLR